MKHHLLHPQEKLEFRVISHETPKNIYNSTTQNQPFRDTNVPCFSVYHYKHFLEDNVNTLLVKHNIIESMDQLVQVIGS